jgi:predicted CoA-binding protein
MSDEKIVNLLARDALSWAEQPRQAARDVIAVLRDAGYAVVPVEPNITEAVIRADERAKVIEECAKVAEGAGHYVHRDEIAAAIRALANPSPAAPVSPSGPGQSETQGG